jgi:hypothetical protein
LPPSGPDAETVVRLCRVHRLFLRNAAAMSLQLGDRCVRIAVKDAMTNARMTEILRQAIDSSR